MGSRRLVFSIGLTIGAVVLIQQAWVSPANFGGADEWLLLDLCSRGILGIPYANRPLVLLWQTPAAALLPGDLRGFWLLTTLYLGATGALTAWLALRLAPGVHTLALLAGVATVAWAPLDYLRLDTVLICGYAGATCTIIAALVLFVESWHRKRPAILALGVTLGLVVSRGGESSLPVLAVAPALLWREARMAPRRFASWTLAWGSMVAVGAGLAVAPLLLGRPSYQSGAIGLDPSPLGVGARVLQLLGMQAEPLFASRVAELAVPAVPFAVLAFVAGLAVLPRDEGSVPAHGPAGRTIAFALAAGLVLAISAHAMFALAPAVRTPARTQVLAAPGFALALAATIAAAARLVAPPWRLPVTGLLGVWIVAVGTGRVVVMQAEWDASRNAYPAQSRMLSDLTAAAPDLERGSLVLLLDDGGAWPMTFTFRHALRYLYGEGVVGIVRGGADFLYPWNVTDQGIVVSPWPVIRGEWRVAPTFHPWDTILVVHRGADGRLSVLPKWPEGVLPPLPAGARYAPERLIRPTPVRVRERRVLAAQGPV
jgi:hypothetical protein